MRYFCLAIALLATAVVANAQRVVTTGLILSNGKSSIEVQNPNTSGNFILQLPEVPLLAPGETTLLQLRAVGTPNGALLSFDVPGSTETLTMNGTGTVTPPLKSVNTDPVSAGTPKVVHTFTELDLPLIVPGSSFIAKVNVAGIVAGAAISVSPAGEMPGSLHPAYGWAPIDCVVLIKFTNNGTTPIDLEPMQFAVGAINP